MRKRWICVIVLILFAILLVYPRKEASYFPVIEANWGVVFPEEAQWDSVYQCDSGPSFHGDGWRYHVYTYAQETPVAALFSWSEETGEALFSKTYRDASEDWLNQLEVPSALRPDYASCLTWYTSKGDLSQILVFWNAGAQTIYIVENFI